MRLDDVPRADLVSYEALSFAFPATGESEADRARRGQARIAHLATTDPGGAWVAEDGAGRVAGLALALVREGIWGLSLFAVRPDLQGQGVGARLLEAALAYGEDSGARGAIILSSTDPRAMRRYARAGFALLPCVTAAGMVDRDRAPDPPPGLRAGTSDDLELTAAVSREVRGATHAPDIPVLLDHGCELLVLEDRGFVVHRQGSPRLLAARDEPAASALLWAALTAGPRGSTVDIEFLTAGQDWAVAVALEAGLALSPEGPVFVRGELGPLRPYIPSGAYL